MHSQLEKLRVDHHNLDLLFNRLNKELDAVNRDLGADFFMTSHILDYISHFPDQLHHPHENLLYARLAEQFPMHRALTASLQQEHGRLERLTKSLAELVQSVLVGQPISREELQRASTAYVLASRAHMAREEAEVFPLIDELFTAQDWASIEERLRGREVRASRFNETRGFDHLLTRVMANEGAITTRSTLATS